MDQLARMISLSGGNYSANNVVGGNLVQVGTHETKQISRSACFWKYCHNEYDHQFTCHKCRKKFCSDHSIFVRNEGFDQKGKRVRFCWDCWDCIDCKVSESMKPCRSCLAEKCPNHRFCHTIGDTFQSWYTCFYCEQRN